MKQQEKEATEMNAYAVKPNVTFASTKKIERKNPTEASRKIAEFIDTHNISVVTKGNGCKIEVTKK